MPSSAGDSAVAVADRTAGLIHTVVLVTVPTYLKQQNKNFRNNTTASRKQHSTCDRSHDAVCPPHVRTWMRISLRPAVYSTDIYRTTLA
jgi:hypothetical protein